MRLAIQVLALASLFPHDVLAHISTGRERYGVIGYGIVMYDPPCAYACIDTVKGWTLDCGDDHDMSAHSSSGHMAGATPECKATNDAFLQTLAWCFHSHCQDQKNSTLERVWEEDIVGRLKVQPSPKFSYQVALARAVEQPPTEIVDGDAVLNGTSLVDEEAWLGNFNGDEGFEKMEVLAEKYGIILMVTCVAIPIAASLLRFIPLPQSLVSKFYATVIDPPLFGSYHSVPVLGLGFIPTRGQGLFIAYIWIINIILSSVSYEIRNPMSWYASLEQQLINYISNRVGLLSFVNLAIAVLFSSRNNLLLFVTNWSHSTFLLLHRWIAVICTLQACLHSAIYLQFYLDPLTGEGAFEEESKLDYWIWGIVATLALSLLIPLSIFPLRQKMYEVFLASHIVLAVLSMIGCMLHIYYRYEWQWGYQTWVWVAFAFWLFDRFLVRPLRIVQNGVKRAFVMVIDEDYMQVTVPGIEAEGHVYLYFPTLSWKVWENHPFSVATISSGRAQPPESVSERASSDAGSREKQVSAVNVQDLEARSDNANIAGMVLFVRRQGGLTSTLSKKSGSTAGLPVLVEGSYGSDASILTSPSLHPTFEYPNIICIAGGVGITCVLPVLMRNLGSMGPLGKRKLFWGVRTEPLVQAVRALVPIVEKTGTGNESWNGFDVAVSVGERIKIKSSLAEEVDGAKKGTLVIVCGPASMADEARMTVSDLGRRGATVRLVEESFAW